MQNQESAIEVKVGALVLFATALLVTFVLILGDFSFSPGFEFEVEFNNAGGLKPGGDVAIAGLNVGTVQRLRFIQNEKAEASSTAVAVRATLTVDEEFADAIRENSEFFITTRGVLGEPYIEIVTKDFDAKPIENGAVLRGVDPPRMDIIVARASELLTSLNELLDDPEIQTKDLIRNTASLMKNLDGVLVDNREDLDATVDNVRGGTEEAKKLLESLNVAVEDGNGLKRTLKHAEVASKNAASISGTLDKDLEPILENADATLRSARNASESAERLVTGNEGKLDKSLDDVSESTARLNKISQDAETVMAAVKNGEGTVGALLTEREMYDDLKELLRDIKQRPWKIVWKE